MSDIDLESKFPDMRPLKSPPALGAVLGCGVSFYGRRDHDDETDTYVTTHCLSLLYLPVLALAAYRVADGHPGYYFLGRVPLSMGARLWNWLFLGVLLGLVGVRLWDKYTHSPGYLARQQMEEADRLADAGQVAPAARLYRDVALGGTEHAVAASAKVGGLVDRVAEQASSEEAVAVYRCAVEVQQRREAFPNLFGRGLDWVKKHGASDPRGALALLDVIAPLAPDETALNAARRPLLERVVARDPADPEPASQLAVIYEAEHHLVRCEALLRPHRRRLGTREGARILGQILARQGKIEQAHALLLPYAEEHLKQLHKAEEALVAAMRAVRERINKEAQVGAPPGFPLERYRRAGKEEQQKIEQEYILSRMKAAPAVKAAEAAVVRESAVVPVALDVGIVLLRRAQAEVDPAKRRAGLERAEKMFLAVRGQAQESDEYRLFLGQVYYWLGKHAEGRKLFDALLKEHHRSYQSLTEVSELLHEIGALAEGRALASEAYRKEDDADKKYAAAGLRATMALDTDDQITWLRRSNPADAGIKALLQAALGDKAMAEGKDEAAAEHLRQAADLYARQPENAVTFNNGGLVYIRLYRVSGDQEALDKAAAMFEKALALQGGDSIVLSNAAGSMLDRALRDVIGAAIDFKALKAGGSVEMLFYLYRDQSGREKYVRRLRTDAGVAKALAYYDRLAVLRPKRASPYSNLLSIYAYRRDPEALRGLLRRLEGVDLDLSDETRQALDFYAGKDDAKRRKEWKAGIQRQQDSVRVARKGARGATLAVAASTLADLKMSLDQLGEAVDAAEVVALAEEAHAAAPSQATQSSLVRALLFRAGQTLARQEPPYTAMVTRARRSLSPSYLLAVGLSLDAKLRDAARKNPDVQRAVALVLQETREFPDDPSPWSWALLRGVHPEEAAKVAKALRKDELGRLERSITQQLTPVGAGTAFAACWALQAAGKEAEARAVLKACARRGVPMPFEVK